MRKPLEPLVGLGRILNTAIRMKSSPDKAEAMFVWTGPGPLGSGVRDVPAEIIGEVLALIEARSGENA